MTKKGLLFLSAILLISFSVGLFFPGCASQPTPAEPGKEAEPTEPAQKAEPAEAFETITLSYASFLPAASPIETKLTPVLIEEIEKATGGRIKIESYHGGSLLGGPDMYDGVMEGIADIGLYCPGWGDRRFPVSFLLEQPAVPFQSSRAAGRAYDEIMRTLAPPDFKDVKVLMYWACGPASLLSNVPIRVMEDMQGLEIRVNPPNIPAAKAFGASPINLSAGEYYEAFQTGIIDANMVATESLLAFNLREVVDYRTFYPFFNSNFLYIMNKDSFNSLPGDLQNIIEEVFHQIWEEIALDFFDIQNEHALKVSVEEGYIEDIVVSDEEYERWRKQIEHILLDYAKELDDKGLPGTEAMELMYELADKYN